MATTPLYDMVDTWNNAPTVFAAIKINVTDTASDATSKLLDMQVGAVSQFSVDKNGIIEANNGTLISDMAETWDNVGTEFDAIQMNVTDTGSAAASNLLNLQINGAPKFRVDKTGTIQVATATQIAMERGARLINATNGDHYFGATGETLGGASASIRMAANQDMIFRTNNTNRWQIDFADGHLQASTDNVFDIGGAGANRPRNLFLAGGTVVMSNLPTSDPTNAGQLYNNSGVVTVSTG